MLDCIKTIMIEYIITPMGIPTIIAALVSSAVLIVVTIVSILWNRAILGKNSEIVRSRETMTLIHQILWDASYIEIRNIFIKARDGRTGIKGFIGKPNTKEFKAINKMMSHYEVLAIGIKRGILSEKVLKDFMGKRLVADWHASKAFVMAVREKNDDETNYIFCEFENLAKKWEKEQ